MRKGMWSPEEDDKLKQFLSRNGYHCWNEVAKKTGLQRCGKSCRLRWKNYLRPGLRRSKFSIEEKNVVMELHKIYGNKWIEIAKHLEGRTDNDVKNIWHSQFKMRHGILNHQKEMLPKNLAHLSSIMSRSSTKQKREEEGLITNNQAPIQPQLRPKIFPFNLDLDNIGNSSHVNPNQQCPTFKHIEIPLPLLHTSESSMQCLGVGINCPMGHSISSPIISTNYNSLDLKLENDKESTIPFSLQELEAIQEWTKFHMIIDNVPSLPNASHDSLDVMANQVELKHDEYPNYLFSWYNQQHNSDPMDAKSILANMNDDEVTSSIRSFGDQILDLSVQTEPLLCGPFSSIMDFIDHSIFQSNVEDTHPLLQHIS